MATADVIAEVAYARFLREFDYGIIWPRVSMDVSAELSEYGDSISFPTDDSPTRRSLISPWRISRVVHSVEPHLA